MQKVFSLFFLSFSLLPYQMSLSLSTFSHPAAQRPHQWDLRAVPGIRQFLPTLQNANRRSLVETVLKAFETNTKHCDTTLPWAVRNTIECMRYSAQDDGEVNTERQTHLRKHTSDQSSAVVQSFQTRAASFPYFAVRTYRIPLPRALCIALSGDHGRLQRRKHHCGPN